MAVDSGTKVGCMGGKGGYMWNRGQSMLLGRRKVQVWIMSLILIG